MLCSQVVATNSSSSCCKILGAYKIFFIYIEFILILEFSWFLFFFFFRTSSVTALNESGSNSHRGLLPVEELSHLRSQMAKLNRRLMTLEMDNLQRQQREKYLLALGLGYFLVKFVIWLNK